jgi:hypothetical protein
MRANLKDLGCAALLALFFLAPFVGLAVDVLRGWRPGCVAADPGAVRPGGSSPAGTTGTGVFPGW